MLALFCQNKNMLLAGKKINLKNCGLRIADCAKLRHFGPTAIAY